MTKLKKLKRIQPTFNPLSAIAFQCAYFVARCSSDGKYKAINYFQKRLYDYFLLVDQNTTYRSAEWMLCRTAPYFGDRFASVDYLTERLPLNITKKEKMDILTANMLYKSSAVELKKLFNELLAVSERKYQI